MHKIWSFHNDKMQWSFFWAVSVYINFLHFRNCFCLHHQELMWLFMQHFVVYTQLTVSMCSPALYALRRLHYKEYNYSILNINPVFAQICVIHSFIDQQWTCGLVISLSDRLSCHFSCDMEYDDAFADYKSVMSFANIKIIFIYREMRKVFSF